MQGYRFDVQFPASVTVHLGGKFHSIENNLFIISKDSTVRSFVTSYNFTTCETDSSRDIFLCFYLVSHALHPNLEVARTSRHSLLS